MLRKRTFPSPGVIVRIQLLFPPHYTGTDSLRLINNEDIHLFIGRIYASFIMSVTQHEIKPSQFIQTASRLLMNGTGPSQNHPRARLWKNVSPCLNHQGPGCRAANPLLVSPGSFPHPPADTLEVFCSIHLETFLLY